jgi:hypothetical protein
MVIFVGKTKAKVEQPNDQNLLLSAFKKAGVPAQTESKISTEVERCLFSRAKVPQPVH